MRGAQALSDAGYGTACLHAVAFARQLAAQTRLSNFDVGCSAEQCRLRSLDCRKATVPTVLSKVEFACLRHSYVNMHATQTQRVQAKVLLATHVGRPGTDLIGGPAA